MSAKILIIDDDRDFVDAAQKLLEANGYQVITAFNGSDGYDRARIETPDLITLDVMMDKTTEGFEVARELNKLKETKNIPIILITGIRKSLNLPFGFQKDENWLPVKSILEKPLNPHSFLKGVQEALKK